MRSSISEQRNTLLDDSRTSSPARSIFGVPGRVAGAAEHAEHRAHKGTSLSLQVSLLGEAQLCG